MVLGRLKTPGRALPPCGDALGMCGDERLLCVDSVEKGLFGLRLRGAGGALASGLGVFFQAVEAAGLVRGISFASLRRFWAAAAR